MKDVSSRQKSGVFLVYTVSVCFCVSVYLSDSVSRLYTPRCACEYSICARIANAITSKCTSTLQEAQLPRRQRASAVNAPFKVIQVIDCDASRKRVFIVIIILYFAKRQQSSTNIHNKRHKMHTDIHNRKHRF